MLMQRVHADDPAAAALATGQWRHLNLPAIAAHQEDISLSAGRSYRQIAGTALDEIREPLSVLEELRLQMGDLAFAAQYLQAPEQPEGGIFKRSWFKYAKEFPFDEPDAQIIQSWDTAMVTSDAADWSVCTTWLVQNDNFYLMEVHRKRYTYPVLKQAIIRLRKDYRPSYHHREKRRRDQPNPGFARRRHRNRALSGKKEKAVRAGRAAVPINAGRVFLSENLDPTMKLFMAEVLAFPVGRYDDRVNSMVQAIDWWEQNRRRPTALFGCY